MRPKTNGEVIDALAVIVAANPVQNLLSPLQQDGSGNLVRTPGNFINDGRQIFVKISYLLQY